MLELKNTHTHMQTHAQTHTDTHRHRHRHTRTHTHRHTHSDYDNCSDCDLTISDGASRADTHSSRGAVGTPSVHEFGRAHLN